MIHPRYKICLDAHNSFDAIATELFRHGFVFGRFRLKTIEEIDKEYSLKWSWSDISIGIDSECRMVLHANGLSMNECKLITLEDFLKIPYYHRLT